MPRDQWEVLITGHHEGWVTWQTCLANQQRIAGNTRPQARQPGTGAVRDSRHRTPSPSFVRPSPS